MKSRSGLAKWSRYLSESGTDEGHITVNYSYDTLTQSELCNRAITQLKKLCQVEINYEVDIVSLPKSIQIGDRINVIDEEGELYLEARILKLEKSRANKENKATLGDFLIKDSGISERLKQLADKVATIKSGDTYYPWVRYADDDKGNGFSATPLNKAYMAIKYGLNQPTPSDDLKDYLGLWVKIVGPEGLSIEGPPGTDGKTKYMWVAYADDVNGNGISIKQDGKMYLGLSYNQDTNIQSLKPKDYTWSAMYDKTALDAVNKRLNEVNSTTMSTIEPTDPKDNDNWWKIDSNNEVIGIYKFVDGKWVPSQIQQDNLIIKELISVAINSANITGSKIVNTFKDVQFEGAKLTGTTTIDGATIRIDFLTDSGQTGGVFINPFAIEGYINKLDGSRLNSYSLSSSNLSFTNGSLSGTLTAESLAPASWENLSLTSDATVSEGNTPFFRKIKNLDGSYSVELLGQVKKTSGNFSTSNTIIAQLPVNFRPGRTWMFMQADNVFKGARVSITDSGYIQIHSANNSGYVSLTGISFLQEK